MINVRKGTAHSLQQADVLGTVNADYAVVAGMVCVLDNSTGTIIPGAYSSSYSGDPVSAASLLGFAINNQTDSDVIASGKIGLYTLDGNSVIETDQTGDTAITTTNFPIGANLTAVADGQVAVTTTKGDVVVGQVYGVRSFPSTNVVTDSNGNATVIQTFSNILAIKLASAGTIHA
jgi:hypothetical protein